MRGTADIITNESVKNQDEQNIEEKKEVDLNQAQNYKAQQSFVYPVQVKMLELDIISCDEFCPQDRRLFAKEVLFNVLKEAVSHDNCIEMIVSKFQNKYGGSWNCATWTENFGEVDIVAKADQKMRLKVRGQIYQICEARDSLVLPTVIVRDDIEVEQDSITCNDELSESLSEMMVSMLATNSSIEECGVYARTFMMDYDEKWIVFVGIKGSFAYEEQQTDVIENAPESITLTAKEITLLVRRV